MSEEKVREHPLYEQFEKETVLQVDKEEKMVHFHSRIGSHIRTVLNSDNDSIQVTDKFCKDGDIYSIKAKIPLDSITISIKDKPKKTGNLSSMLI